jgi:preprotein translocase SecE subunit
VKSIFAIPGKLLKFLQSVPVEIKRIEFPTRQKTLNLTSVVFFGSILLSITLFMIDALFINIRYFLTKLN